MHESLFVEQMKHVISEFQNKTCLITNDFNININKKYWKYS